MIFPISVRSALESARPLCAKGGFKAVVIKLRLPDGQLYGQEGHLDYVSPIVAPNTDTITLRGVIPKPAASGPEADAPVRANWPTESS